jgi:hypothetical protein
VAPLHFCFLIGGNFFFGEGVASAKDHKRFSLPIYFFSSFFFFILFFGNILNVYQFMQIFSKKKKKSIHAEVFGIFALLQEKIRKYETLKSSEKAVIVLSIS